MKAGQEEWLSRVERAQKRADTEWRNDAREALRIYHGSTRPRLTDEALREPFNILFSNTETLAPALFNSAPRPDVSARRAKSDPITKIGAQALHQYLDFLVDCNDARYEAFSESISQAVVSALVPGIGQVRVREPLSPGAHLSVESVAFDRFLWGWARRWQDVPWVAFGHDLTYPDFKARYPKHAKLVTEDQSSEFDAQAGQEGEHNDNSSRLPGTLVWEIWDKTTKQIYVVSDVVKDEVLEKRPWPLNFSSSFPCPRPLAFVDKVASLTPSTLYSYYEAQARELNRITRRLNRIIEALKVRGVYNSMIAEIETLLEDGDENKLVPSKSAVTVAEQGGLDKHIWLMPIEQLVKVAKELFNAREVVKTTIFEIMGIADLLRGASVASETATAQNIKDRWGTLRLKKYQRKVQFFIRDLFRLLAEAAPQVVPPEAWSLATDLKLPSQADKAQAQQKFLALQMQVQSMPPPLGDPQGPDPMQQEMQGLQQTLAIPSWEEVLAFLKDQAQRTYLIDVESNSTVDIEATEDKEAISEFMNAMGQFLSGIAPLVENGSLPFEAAKGMLMEIMRRFRFSKQVEEYLSSMQPPQPQQTPEAKKEAEKAMEEVKAEGEKLKDLEEKIKDALRQVQGERKEFEQDKKLAVQEFKHMQEMAAAKDQARQVKAQADEQVKMTKLGATADKLSSGIQVKEQAFQAKAKEMKETEKSVQSASAPIMQAVQDLVKAQQQITEQLTALAEQVMNMSSDEDEREIAMMGRDGQVRTAVVRKRKKTQPSNLN